MTNYNKSQKSSTESLENTPKIVYHSPLQLAWRRFRSSSLGMFGAIVLIILYTVALLAPFLSPYDITYQHKDYINQPPQRIRIWHNGKPMRPFVYPVSFERDPVTYKRSYIQDTDSPLPIHFFVRGENYKFFGRLKTNLHLFGVKTLETEGQGNSGYAFLLGTDRYGRCILSRTLVGSQVSLSVGIVGILISFSIGMMVGGISGYAGGIADTLIQKFIEIMLSFPRLPILLALGTALPASFPSTWVYVGIVTVLSLIGWASIARVVRGQVLSAKTQDYVQAARALGVSSPSIIARHILPNLTSYLLVAASISLPSYILGESALSFLGLGIKEPMTSWGLLLKDAQSFEALRLYPWLLSPSILIIISVLAFNFVGDALRDAADVQS